MCGTIGYWGIREQFLAATPSRRSLTVFHIAIQISEWSIGLIAGFDWIMAIIDLSDHPR